MKRYIGTKIVRAKPMSRQAYNDLRGWKLPAYEVGTDAGYLVEYVDGGKPNHKDFAGYVSWSPAAQFDAAYQTCEQSMDFGMAIRAMKLGAKVARTGWNSAEPWLECVVPSTDADLPYIRISYPANSNAYPKGANVPWFASQTDMLATDWVFV